VAELQITDLGLAVFTAGGAAPARPVERILSSALPPLARRAAHLRICDQRLGFELPARSAAEGPLAWELQAPASRTLFSLGVGTKATVEARGRDRGLYVGLNRVVYDGGRTSPRVGTGLRRVEFSLEP
jgi:hypothetical protein